MFFKYLKKSVCCVYGKAMINNLPDGNEIIKFL